MKTTKKKKTVPILLAVLLLLSFFSAMVYAAYYGKGIFKDVFVNRKSYFTSDLLSSVGSVEEAGDNSVNSAGSVRTVHFYNSDVATGEYNEFDVTFSLYAWFDRASEGTTYTLRSGDRTADIRGTEHGTPVFTGLTLSGKRASVCDVTVSLGFTEGTDLSAYPGLFLAAVPETPAYLGARILGARILPSVTEGFSAEGAFEYSEDADIDDYAAFSYVISTAGIPPEGSRLVLRWNSAALTLVTENGSLPDNTEISGAADGGTWDKYIEIADPTDYFGTLTFLRVQDADEADNPWADTDHPVGFEELKDFVKLETLLP